MKVVIPMSGMSRRFMDAGYTVPKYLLEIDGKTVIEHIIDLYPKDTEFVCILNRKHHDETDVAGLLLYKLPEGSSIRVIDPHKLGPVHSVLQALKDIDDEEQVIVNYCDFSMNWDYDEFKSHVDDQKRVLTPKQAYKNGSDWLVIGRPITKGNIKNNIQTLINHLN